MVPTVIFYILAAIPFLYGGIMWALNKRIHIMEWLGNAALCFLIAGGFHLLGIYGQTTDVETWSGQITQVVFYPEWVEEYEEMHTRTVDDGNGKSHTEIYYTTEHRTHHKYWEAETTLCPYEISLDFYNQVGAKFGGIVESHHVYKSGFYSGDHNIYPVMNRTNWIQPVTQLKRFENRVKATPSTFSFSKVPEGMKGLYNYPENGNPFSSDRLVGTASATIDLLTFDQMNARLGPTKQVNVIMVGLGKADSMLGEWQRAKWIGGKKNDVVIVWGGNNKKPEWVKCFGWTKSEECKRSLETIVLEHGAVTETLILIEGEIRHGYQLLDWDKTFAHIEVQAPMWALWWYLGFMVVSQVGLWWWFNTNEYDKGGNRRVYGEYYFNR